jgi:hypothetical protein
MIRQILLLLLVSILIVPANLVSAQETASTTTLVERLHNMDAEVERFLESKSLTEFGHLLPS